MSKEVGRRTVLKGITLGAFGLGSVVAVGDLLEVLTFPDGQKVALAKGVILADKSLCSGCRICEIVCANFNSAGRNSPSLSRILLEKEYHAGGLPAESLPPVRGPSLSEGLPGNGFAGGQAEGNVRPGH